MLFRRPAPTCSIRRPPAIPPTRKLNLDLGPEALAGLEPGGAAIEPDVAQQAVIELGQLAAGFAQFGSVEQSLDTDHDRPGQQGARPGRRRRKGYSVWAISRTLDRVDMT